MGKDFATVVTMDGGRYAMLPKGYSDGAHWECYDASSKLTPLLTTGAKLTARTPLQHVVLSGREIKTLEDAGQLPVGSSARLEKARDAGDACTDALWKKTYQPREKANEVADITYSTRQNRAAAIRSQFWDAMPKKCAKQKAEFDAALEAAITSRKQARSALYDGVSPKILK